MRARIATLFLLLTTSAYAQISPPGIDGAQAVAWGAIGFNQPLSKKWSITVYGGGARQSDPDTKNPFSKSAILVINQESLYAFNNRWQLALCTSFRKQNIYSHESPYELDSPSVRKELRYYLRLYYKHSIRRLSFTYSFRPEYRTFYTGDWDNWKTDAELRFRLKAQVNIPLSQTNVNQLILANEILTVMDHYNEPVEGKNWSPYHFTEDRFVNFFRHTFKKPDVIFDVGVMHQFWEEKTTQHLHYSAYLSFDILLQHPFGSLKSHS